LTQKVLAQVPQTTTEEFDAAVKGASEAFLEWKEVPISQKVRYMLKYQEALKANQEDIAREIVKEHGKTLPDAMGDVFRGFEVVEHACSFGSLAMSEMLENVSKNVDLYTLKTPLGVTAGICPFNFPAMIPLWMYPLATTLGNTMVIKPSEKVPGAMKIMIDLFEQVGVPKGVVQVVQGGRQTVTDICTHPDIKAVSFVGGNQAGEYIYNTSSEHGKRCQVNMGAKNHCIVMPDADKEDALNALTGACFGSTGQRCMSISVVVLVGETQKWIPDLVEKAKQLSVGAGHENVDIAPLNGKANLERAHGIIERASKDPNQKLLLDGRGVKVAAYPEGNFIGPTILDNSRAGMESYDEEIFGPVMNIVRADNFTDALRTINSNPYGNGCSIFTQDGSVARQFQHEVEAGQIGINLPIPVPLPMFSFSGNKKSYRGTSNFYGKGAVNFWTQSKTVTARWKQQHESPMKVQTSMPTLK
jgi:malonate-semialdehyde dehydrogenase (acetylating)/methylmalonate-semialdehyde dehydrogenase